MRTIEPLRLLSHLVVLFWGTESVFVSFSCATGYSPQSAQVSPQDVMLMAGFALGSAPTACPLAMPHGTSRLVRVYAAPSARHITHRFTRFAASTLHNRVV